MDNLKLYIRTFYRDKIKRYLESLDKQQQQKLTASMYIVLSLFTIAFFGIFAINPTLSTISELQKQYEDYKKLSDDMDTKIKALNDLGLQYQTIEPTLFHLDNALPIFPDIAPLTRKVETLGQHDAVNIERFNISPIELFPQITNLPLTPITFSLSASGDNEPLSKLISDIINFDRLVTIESLSLTIKNNDKTLTTTGKVYFKKNIVTKKSQ